MSITFLTFTNFQIFIHLLVAFVFLVELLKDHLPIIVYNFMKKYKDIIFGCYYIYLAYNIYLTNKDKFID